MLKEVSDVICNLCPRKCNLERNSEIGNGYCKMPELPKVARAGLHFWEEPCISGTNGSGTIFFSGCSLGCVFCQNNEISHKNFGKKISIERLAEIFKELENKGAHNINLVNPTHYIDAIEKAFGIYKPNIPLVYNSSGFDTETQIERASKFTDIFLMDYKYRSNLRAKKYSKAENYPEVAECAIIKCAEIVKENVIDQNGIMQKGIIIRHLIMPQGTNDAIEVIKWVENNVPWAFFSLMSQFTPCGALTDYKEINRKITKREYQKVLDFASETKIDTIFTQELSSSNTDYIPPFNLEGV
jgi:putative pyruvate formate lyase activating enzyme